MAQPLSAQAFGLCRTDAFQRYAESQAHMLFGCFDEEHTANWLRKACGITSRGQLDTDLEVAAKFVEIVSEYHKSLAQTESFA